MSAGSVTNMKCEQEEEEAAEEKKEEEDVKNAQSACHGVASHAKV